jgi:predicted DNA-binding protein
MTHRADYRGYDEVLSVRVARKTTLLLDLVALTTERQRADVVRDALDRYIDAMPAGVATAGAAP